LKRLPKAVALLLAVYALPLGIRACNYVSPTQPVLGYENNDQYCEDGLDNDHDGLVDCEDPHCIQFSVHCGEHVPLAPYTEPEGWPLKPPYSLMTCHDFIDNDQDGQFDCGDSGCQLIAENCCSRENDNVTCSDGIDNDESGRTDCEQRSCYNSGFVAVCEDDETGSFDCTDGHDNDQNGLIDCDDPQCASLSTCEPKAACPTPVDCSVAACVEAGLCSESDCADTLDNDGDTLADCEDPDCAEGCNNPLGPQGQEVTYEACRDGIDNDENGFTDCKDFSCQGSDDPKAIAWCDHFLEASVAKCGDGIDNDGNGFTDCNDFSCSKSQKPEVIAHCESVLELDVPSCTDGVDNDGNGFTDCDDFSCSQSEDQAVLDACADFKELGLEKCSDGVDNDGNGYSDCGDNSCSGSLEPDVMEHCDKTTERSMEKCTDGIDNDGNGYGDCRDFSCRNSTDEEVASFCTEGYVIKDGVIDIEASIAECTDGIDNNNDAYTDCADRGCLRDAHDIAVGRACQESLVEEKSELDARCCDGLDNDNDGFTDCEDFDCSYHPDISVCVITVEAACATGGEGLQKVCDNKGIACNRREDRKKICE